MVVTLSVNVKGIAQLHGSMTGFLNAFPKEMSKDVDTLSKEISKSMANEIKRPRKSGFPLRWKNELYALTITPKLRKDKDKEMRTWALPLYAEWLNKTRRGTYKVPTFSEEGELATLKRWADQRRSEGKAVPLFIVRYPTYWLDIAMAMAKINIDEKMTGGLNTDRLLKKLEGKT